MTGTDRRQELLEAAIDHVARHGLADASLRGIADGIGTSHRMLSHHFGSKEGLWVAIVDEVERRQRAELAALAERAPATTDPDAISGMMRSWWLHISDPSLWPNVRLFFELYAQALQGASPATELLDDVVDSWVRPAAAMARSAGVADRDADRFARLGLAVTRGLLLDLLATQDRASVDAAMELWVELTTAWLQASTDH